MINYTHCPICNATTITPQLTTIDYTVSKKSFAVWHCNNCTARFTQGVPEQNAIGEYYQSENYISHSNTKKGFVNTLYHWVRANTLNKKKQLLINEVGVLKGDVLDIGCGTGAFLHTMKKAGWGITGLEPDASARKSAATLYDVQPLSSEKIYDLLPSTYHAITMWHVLEHVHELHSYLNQLHKILTPKGKLFIAVPNYTSKDAKIYDKYWAAYDVPRHLYHFSPKAMKQLLSSHNFTLTKLKPMWYDSFYVSMLSEKYKSGKGNFLKAFWNGLLSNINAIGHFDNCSSVIYVVSKK